MTKKAPQRTQTEIEEDRRRLGLPDWRDAQSYRYTEKLDDRRLRWEFVRRHPEYRKAWLAGRHTRPRLLHSMVDPAINGIDFPEEAVFLDDFAGKPVPFIPPNVHHFLTLDPAGQHHYPAEMIGRQVLDLGEGGIVILAFDPTLPVTAQLKSARQFLEKCRDEAINEGQFVIHRRKARPYDAATALRLIDAQSEGVSFRQMGQVILGLRDPDPAGRKAHDRYEVASEYWRGF